jgi:ketosteroid isomerase-like protein
MSENLDLVRSIFADWERGDWSSADWADPEIEFEIADGIDRGSWRGVGRMAEGWRAWASTWQEVRAEADEYRELDDERVLVLIRYGGRGKTSGLELGRMDTNAANLFYVSGGKVTRFVIYADRELALAHLGLKQ